MFIGFSVIAESLCRPLEVIKLPVDVKLPIIVSHTGKTSSTNCLDFSS